MAQFDIYRRLGGGVEFLLDLQDEMLESLTTRVVAPLVPLEAVETPIKPLNPLISIGGIQYVLLIHLLAAIPGTALGELEGSARTQRDEIIGAIDFLFTGI
jgi:toxin CcdB